MRLHDFTNEIAAIAAANNTGRDNASDMFLANAEQGINRYKGADSTDWVSLKPHITELRASLNDFRDAHYASYKRAEPKKSRGVRKNK